MKIGRQGTWRRVDGTDKRKGRRVEDKDEGEGKKAREEGYGRGEEVRTKFNRDMGSFTEKGNREVRGRKARI